MWDGGSNSFDVLREIVPQTEVQQIENYIYRMFW